MLLFALRRFDISLSKYVCEIMGLACELFFFFFKPIPIEMDKSQLHF